MPLLANRSQSAFLALAISSPHVSLLDSWRVWMMDGAASPRIKTPREEICASQGARGIEIPREEIRTPHPKAVALLRGVMEALVLLLVCAAPWPYGSVHPGFEFLLLAGVGLLLLLWGARMVLEGRLVWKKCPVLLCLAGLFVLGVWQVIPLSPST